jgi:hypothetical protein
MREGQSGSVGGRFGEAKEFFVLFFLFPFFQYRKRVREQGRRGGRGRRVDVWFSRRKRKATGIYVL